MDLMTAKQTICESREITVSELNLLGAYEHPRLKNKFNCPICKSKDNLCIYEKNGVWKVTCKTGCEVFYTDTIVGVVSREKNISFSETVKTIADRNGIVIDNVVYTPEEKRHFTQLKKEKEAREMMIKKLDDEQTESIINGDIKRSVEIERQKNEISSKPISILKYPNVDYEGKPLKTWDNLQALMEHKNIYTVFNEITKNIEIKGLSSEDLDDCIMDIHTLSVTNGLKMNIDFIGKSINRIGSQNSFNPITDYLENCYKNWDGQKNRISLLCKTLIVAEDFSEDLRDTLVTKWLLNTVKIPFNQGQFNTEGILILQGEQGLGKTTWIRNITPPSLYDYLKTGLDIDPSDKDKIYQAIKYWLVELGELDATMKSEQAKLKQFFTERVDEFRRPYARNTSKYPRKTSFFGTVNKREFLKDETGDRRYWVIPCVDIVNEMVEKINIDQLWGEVMHLWRDENMEHYLTREDLKELNNSNKDFRAKGKTQISVETAFDWEAPETLWSFKKKEDIAQYLNLTTTAGLNEIFEQLGIKSTRGSIEVNGKITRPRGYKVPPYKGEAIDNYKWE